MLSTVLQSIIKVNFGHGDTMDLVLGVGDETNHNLPQKVCINNAVSVSCGSHSAVIDKNGKTWVWGRTIMDN
jgi:Alpha-tubulin suppressor and related RCC1 domain-containing proteins